MENAKYAAVLLLFCGLAHAETEVKTLGDLDRLQSGRVFYDAQAAYNKAKLAANQSDTVSAPAIAMAQPGSPGNSGAPTAQISTLPSLDKVVGSVATLNLADGSSSQVRAGDSVQGNFTVVSVSMRGVVLKRSQDGHIFTLN
ncbi:type IV pilus biogenesis protein PilP [Erwinia psidii]|uniref:type IV pilus biogenesis protein PilP n=1 Tax=Erwinia psidii TaxID=69224 RepID=UPI00226B4B91|nr:type IV pilus biogenesis protein PilP [Erwinia psidii]MCX8963100.1 type IV pilus biogenesis protein PilP [Erwinia psidii]